MVRAWGLEPQRITPREPKSRMSTNSITGAYEGDYQTAIVKLLKKPIAFAIGFFMERATRLELATSTLARWRSTG